MEKVTFKKSTELRGYVASTGESIEYITSKQFGFGGTTGWYIAEADGSMTYNRFATLEEAKTVIIRRHNPMQYTEMVLDRTEKILAKHNAKVGA